MADLIDEVLIANKALIKVGQASIDTLDNAENLSARLMKTLMPMAKQYVFRQYPWNCLRERKIVTVSADTPIFGFDYKYALPADCLRPLAIQSTNGEFIPFYNASYGGAIPTEKQYVVEGDYILTNTSPQTENTLGQVGLNFVYIKNPSNLNILDADVVELLAYYLAIETAYTFTGSVSLKQQLESDSKECLKHARAVNAQEIAPGIPVGNVVGAHW